MNLTLKSFFAALFCLFLFFPQESFALRQNTAQPEQSRHFEILKKDKNGKMRLDKKKVKALKSKIKALKKESKSNRNGLLSDNRIYFGLILVLGGILVTLIFNSLLAWIGGLAIIAGLALLIWALIDGVAR